MWDANANAVCLHPIQFQSTPSIYASIHQTLPVNSTTRSFPNKNRTTFHRLSRHTPLHANPIPFRHRVNTVYALLCPQPPLFMDPLYPLCSVTDPTHTAKCRFPLRRLVKGLTAVEIIARCFDHSG